ncbi:MAG: hypothetical protein IH849_06235 [Acidobacteria bacterium]|nr:hypothetical protein [Acidobacteriota bacterium]
MSPRRSFKVAAVSAAPAFMDRDATVEKACGLIAEAAGQGAELIVFPETFIPTYPMWVWEIPASQGALLGECRPSSSSSRSRSRGRRPIDCARRRARPAPTSSGV